MKYNVTVNGKLYEVEVELVKKSYTPISRSGLKEETGAQSAKMAEKKIEKKPAEPGAAKVVCPMPGAIIDIKVKEGASVKAGDLLLVLEAMKMENEIKSPSSGIIKQIAVKNGDHVDAGDVLIVIE